MHTSSGLERTLRVLARLADDSIASKDELTTLDAVLGDGDLGRTIERGFLAVKSLLEGEGVAEPDLGKLLYKTGKAFSTAAASSFGALLGTAFMKTGMALKGKTDATGDEVVAALRVAMQALMDQGRANIGDKTMLDALGPALDAMAASLAEPATAGSLVAAFRAGASAAQAGAERTREMQSQIGRASWQGERSIGQMDPGARAVAIMLASVAASLAEED